MKIFISIFFVLLTLVSVTMPMTIFAETATFGIGAGGSSGLGGGYGGFGPFVGCPIPPPDFRSVVCIFVALLTSIIPLLAACALLVFFWGLAKFVRNAGSESAREDAKNVMFWGIIGLFVMVSVWGIVAFFFQDIFGGGVGIHPFGIPLLPFSPGQNSSLYSPW